VIPRKHVIGSLAHFLDALTITVCRDVGSRATWAGSNELSCQHSARPCMGQLCWQRLSQLACHEKRPIVARIPTPVRRTPSQCVWAEGRCIWSFARSSTITVTNNLKAGHEILGVARLRAVLVATNKQTYTSGATGTLHRLRNTAKRLMHRTLAVGGLRAVDFACTRFPGVRWI
jgi:hypothetical protein